MMTSRHAPVHTALLVGLLFAAAGCAEPVPQPAPQAPAPHAPAPHAPIPPVAGATTPAPGPIPGASPIAVPFTPPSPDEKPVVFNDPPAPPDTPLCGRQAQERNAIGATLQGASLAASGICARFACYDPLTATYFGADGYRHVCR